MLTVYSKQQLAFQWQQCETLRVCLRPKADLWCPCYHLSKLLSRVLFLLKKLVTEEYLVLVYQGLFHAHIRYGILLWGHAAACWRVLLLQRRALRLICGAQPRDHCRPLFAQLKLMTVYNQFILESLIYVKTKLSNLQSRVEIHEQELCRSRNLNHNWYKLKKTQEGFPSQAVGLFTGLPDRFQLARDPEYRARITKWREKSPFYSIADFYESDMSVLL